MEKIDNVLLINKQNAVVFLEIIGSSFAVNDKQNDAVNNIYNFVLSDKTNVITKFRIEPFVRIITNKLLV